MTRTWSRLPLLVLVLVLVLTLLLVACGSAPAGHQPADSSASADSAVPDATAHATPVASISGEIIVFAAASLTEAYTEIGESFETAYPGTTVTCNFAGSQQLAQQIAQGAPADVFASANSRHMQSAIASGHVVSGTQQVFAHNRLVAIVSNDSPVAVTRLDDLAIPDLKLILAAQEVPVGNYTLEFLNKAATDDTLGSAYKEAVLANVVSYEQNVKAVVTKIVLGEGDAGIVYSSDVTADAAAHITTIDIPDHLNTIATYPIAPVRDSVRPHTAQAFIDYVCSAEGQAVLQKHGFIPSMGVIPNTGE